MPMSGFFRTSARLAVAAVLALALGACLNYGFTGRGGFPSHIRTIFIAPLDNQTVQFEVEQQIYRSLTEKLPRSLGIRPAAESQANAILRGTVTRYENAAQNYRPGGDVGTVDVLQHQVQITLNLQIIDVTKNEILYEASITGRGEYRPDSQSEDVARLRAIELLIQQIIDGAQSQW
jgi:curli biogenesis system outer membrane secretion channel CsgG